VQLISKIIVVLSLLAVYLVPLQAKEQSFIPYVSENNAKGEVKNIYAQVKGAFGMIPAPIMQYSVSPELLKNHWEYFGAVAKNKNFDPRFLAIMRMSIATSGSFQRCDYCVDGNAMVLKSMFKMPASEIKAIQKSPDSAKLKPKEKKMLKFLLTSTSNPKSLSKASFDELRKLGWSDKDIFEGIKMATQMVAAIYMVNTLNISSDFAAN
jgi:uncharacterized peroxidase-related enzyme